MPLGRHSEMSCFERACGHEKSKAFHASSYATRLIQDLVAHFCCAAGEEELTFKIMQSNMLCMKGCMQATQCSVLRLHAEILHLP